MRLPDACTSGELIAEVRSFVVSRTPPHMRAFERIGQKVRFDVNEMRELLCIGKAFLCLMNVLFDVCWRA